MVGTLEGIVAKLAYNAGNKIGIHVVRSYLLFRNTIGLAALEANLLVMTSGSADRDDLYRQHVKLFWDAQNVSLQKTKKLDDVDDAFYLADFYYGCGIFRAREIMGIRNAERLSRPKGMRWQTEFKRLSAPALRQARQEVLQNRNTFAALDSPGARMLAYELATLGVPIIDSAQKVAAAPKAAKYSRSVAKLVRSVARSDQEHFFYKLLEYPKKLSKYKELENSGLQPSVFATYMQKCAPKLQRLIDALPKEAALTVLRSKLYEDRHAQEIILLAHQRSELILDSYAKALRENNRKLNDAILRVSREAPDEVLNLALGKVRDMKSVDLDVKVQPENGSTEEYTMEKGQNSYDRVIVVGGQLRHMELSKLRSALSVPVIYYPGGKHEGGKRLEAAAAAVSEGDLVIAFIGTLAHKHTIQMKSEAASVGAGFIRYSGSSIKRLVTLIGEADQRLYKN